MSAYIKSPYKEIGVSANKVARDRHIGKVHKLNCPCSVCSPSWFTKDSIKNVEEVINNAVAPLDKERFKYRFRKMERDALNNI